MRILMLIPQVFYSARGTPLSAYHRILDLMALGHHVEVLTYKIGEPPPKPGLKVHRSFGPHLARNLKQGPSLMKIWFDLLLFVKLICLLLRNRYDTLYAHEEGAFLGALVAPIFRIPLIYDMHSSLPLQLGDWEFSHSELVASLFRWIERFILKSARVTISIGPGITQAALQSFPHANVVTLLNCFSIESNATELDGSRIRQELGLHPSHRMVLYTGSFVRLQSLHLLIDSIPLVISKCPQARFVCVGGTQEEIKDLKQLATDRNVLSHLILLSKRPQAEIPAFLAASDALVSPRIKGINPPGKLFSYLSSGRPVVATKCQVHTQLLDDSIAVLTSPDPEGLAEGILRALTDTEYVQTIVTSAKRFVESNYGFENRLEGYRQLFQLLEESNSTLIKTVKAS